MVSAGVRSKGCRTCRSRRVRCDERHPFCLRCEDGSFVCEGFGHDMKFVDENSRTACQVRKKKSVPISIPTMENNHEINKLAFSERWSHLGIREYQSPAVSKPPRFTEDRLVKNEDLVIRILISTNCTKLVTSLDLSGFRDNIQISFTLSMLLRGFPMTVLWMLEGVSNDSEMSTPTQALLALSSVFFGRIHKQQQCIDNGSMQHCKALRNLNTDLNSSRATDVDVLTGVMSLWLYEMLASRSSEGALKHAGGIGILIRLRGPERHQSPFELHLLESIRISVIHDGLITRKRIFLEQEAWKTIPWSQSATPKSMNSQLQDILCDIPGLMEDYDKVNSMGLTTPEATLYYEALYSRINRHLTMLYDWRLRWELLYPDRSQEVKNNEDSPTGSGAIFPTVLNFTSLEVANGIMLYDASLLLLINIGMDLTNNNFDHQSPAPQLSYQHENTALYQPGQASRYEIALEICRSVDYYLLPGHAFAGAFCVLLPLRVAFGAMVPGSDEAEWILATLFRVGEFSGFEISKGLVS